MMTKSYLDINKTINNELSLKKANSQMNYWKKQKKISTINFLHALQNKKIAQIKNNFYKNSGSLKRSNSIFKYDHTQLFKSLNEITQLLNHVNRLFVYKAKLSPKVSKVNNFLQLIET